MSQVAKAVYKAFKPDKLNYELLGNTDAHLHWHLFPRRHTDPEPHRTIWTIPITTRQDSKYLPSPQDLSILKHSLNYQLDKLHL